jgi:CDP-glycerol:poly(glycerophosphate) glycerophosphotransferase
MAQPVLFVAREPDETLRTYLPVIDEVQCRGVQARVLFHHWPSAWAREELLARDVSWWHVALPDRELPGFLENVPLPGRAEASVGEIGQLRAVRHMARRIIEQERPRALIVIQDTLLLERFLVRSANRKGIPTVVVQWAFNFPQDYYDRLRALKAEPATSGPRAPRPSLGLYKRVQEFLDIDFELVNSYGGGEARAFAVMGPFFADQYRAQGVAGKAIVVTGHPLHDAAFRRSREMDQAELGSLRARLGIPSGEHIVLYATQPFFWRGVITPEELRENVRAMNAAVCRLGADYRLTVKIHPRESPEDYAFCADLDPPIRVIPRAEMTDLIALADIFISSSSSTVLLAMMLDRPIVTVNFNQVLHFDFFEPLGGTLHVRTFEELSDALQRIVKDESTRNALAEGRRAALDRLACFDGHASERVADLLVPALNLEAAPSPSGGELG